jgi:hypothetical protein
MEIYYVYHHLSYVHHMPQLINITTNSEINHTYFFNYTSLIYKISSLDS